MPAAAPIILGTMAVIGTGYIFKKVRPPHFFFPWGYKYVATIACQGLFKTKS